VDLVCRTFPWLERVEIRSQIIFFSLSGLSQTVQDTENAGSASSEFVENRGCSLNWLTLNFLATWSLAIDFAMVTELSWFLRLLKSEQIFCRV
jgi:hypothetical protein